MVKIIGIAGTAKNTGKTTVTLALLEETRKRNIKTGLTSIGYDGEEIDNVTGLPKPRIMVGCGDIVAIAEKCLNVSTAEIEIIEKTDFLTPLGKIIIGVINKEGLVVLAGPNKSKDLKIIISLLKKYGSEFIIIDGALNRLVPMTEAEGIILATGAARNKDIKRIAAETANIIEVFQLDNKYQCTKSREQEHIGILLKTIDNKDITINTTSLITDETVKKLIKYIDTKKIEKIFIPGIISLNNFDKLLSTANEKLNNIQLIFEDPIKLIISGNPFYVNDLINKSKKLCAYIGVSNSIPIIAVTINPFYPQYRHSLGTYSSSYIDDVSLEKTMKKYIKNIPVINIVKEGGSALFELL